MALSFLVPAWVYCFITVCEVQRKRKYKPGNCVFLALQFLEEIEKILVRVNTHTENG